MDIDLNATGDALTIQNISILISNFKNTMVLNREIGIDSTILDSPITQNFYIPNLKKQIEKYCGVEVTSISFENTLEQINVIVKVIL